MYLVSSFALAARKYAYLPFVSTLWLSGSVCTRLLVYVRAYDDICARLLRHLVYKSIVSYIITHKNENEYIYI